MFNTEEVNSTEVTAFDTTRAKTSEDNDLPVATVSTNRDRTHVWCNADALFAMNLDSSGGGDVDLEKSENKGFVQNDEKSPELSSFMLRMPIIPEAKRKQDEKETKGMTFWC